MPKAVLRFIKCVGIVLLVFAQRNSESDANKMKIQKFAVIPVFKLQ